MFLLGKAHIGEVQVSTWDDETIETCHNAGDYFAVMVFFMKIRRLPLGRKPSFLSNGIPDRPSSVSCADSYGLRWLRIGCIELSPDSSTPRGSLRALLRWGDYYGILLQ